MTAARTVASVAAELEAVREAGATALAAGATALSAEANRRAARLLGQLITLRNRDAQEARNAHLATTARGPALAFSSPTDREEAANEAADRAVAAAEEAAQSPILYIVR
jgi:hypothetical protein